MPASGGRAVEKQIAVRHLPSMLDKAAAKVQMAWRERAASRAQIVDEHKAAVKIQVCSTHAPQTLRTRSVHAPQHDPHTLRARSTHLLRTLYTRSATLSAPRALCICSRACPPERVPASTSARAAAAAPSLPLQPLHPHGRRPRHPYSWLLAMKANPYEYDGYWLQSKNMSLETMTFSEFIRQPYLTQGRGTLDANDDRGDVARAGMSAGRAARGNHIATVEYANPIQMWNAKVASYVDVNASKVIVRHEELFDLDRLRQKLVPLVNYGFVLATEGAISYPEFTDVNTPLEYRFSRAAFERSRALTMEDNASAAISEDDRLFIRSQIDHAILQAVGYS